LGHCALPEEHDNYKAVSAFAALTTLAGRCDRRTTTAATTAARATIAAGRGIAETVGSATAAAKPATSTTRSESQAWTTGRQCCARSAAADRQNGLDRVPARAT
jgi:hypothetical protein